MLVIGTVTVTACIQRSQDQGLPPHHKPTDRSGQVDNRERLLSCLTSAEIGHI